MPREDNALIQAVDRAGNVVLATTEVKGTRHSNVFGGDAVLRRDRSDAPGNSLVRPDADGALRRFPYEIQGLRGFAVAAAEAATGEAVGRDGFDSDEAWIDYEGPPTTIPTYSFAEVLRGNVEARQLEDKIVVVGASAPTLQDVWQTSAGGGLMPGAEVQANAIASVLDGLPLRSSPAALDVALIVLLAVAGAPRRVLPAAARRLRRRRWRSRALYLVVCPARLRRGAGSSRSSTRSSL